MVKKYVLVSIILILKVQAFACDDILKQFPKDCALQDRLTAIREQLRKEKIDINEVAEYRVLRLIDRRSWDYARLKRTPPNEIYKPAPTTWSVWDQGIRSIFGSVDFKNILFRDLKIDVNTMSGMNKVLLTNGVDSIKDPNTTQSKLPGEFRVNEDKGVGYCSKRTVDNQGLIDRAESSMMKLQQRWESSIGMTFSDVVARYGGQNPQEANLKSGMYVTDSVCGKDKLPDSVFVSYARTHSVMDRINWMTIFLESNLELYRQGRPALSPVELATALQKWFVSVHPFADGNGRTSRAIQDIVLANFGLPYAPGGDLQNDAMDTYDNYLFLTYNAMDSMLNTLEKCAKNYAKSRLFEKNLFYCQTVTKLNTAQK